MPKLLARLCLALSVLIIAAHPGAAADDRGDELRRAASAGDLAKVKELLGAGVDVNAANSYGGTALAFAADKGRTEVVNLLLERGAAVNVKDSFYGATPLTWAVSHGYAEIARALLAKGAEGEVEALMSAAGEGHSGVVKVILERGKLGPETLSEALAAASQSKQAEVVALLEAAGAKPPVAATIDPAILASYAGTFDGEGFSLTVTAKDGKLVLTTEGGSFTFAPVDQVTFRGEEMPALKLVVQVEEGKVRGMTFHRGENTTPLKKRETP